jgi:hypothetical protein
MRTKIWSKRLLQRIPLFLLLIQLLFAGGTSVINGWTESSNLNPPSNVSHRDTDIPKIVFLLEDKVGSRKVTEKAKDKAFTLSDEQTRLIASLAELTANGAQAAGAELVFLVITILIIVS